MEKLPAIYYGSQAPPVPARELHAGSLACLYVAGSIRHICAGETEIINRVYLALRDRNWGTVPGTLSEERIEAREDTFSIGYNCRFAQGEIDYAASVRIIGSADNSLVFSMRGEALSGFQKNRLGLNILHPIRECAGRVCRVTTPGGAEYRAEFPVQVSPHQPMKNIGSLAWTIGDGMHAIMELSGEVFEMEDQRNWTDASYKTYGTPLDLPFPVRLEKGTAHEQEMRLKVEVRNIRHPADYGNRVLLPGERVLTPFPALGVGKSEESGPLAGNDAILIKDAGFRHYRVDLHLYRQGWPGMLSEGIKEAGEMGLALELGLFFDGEPSHQLSALVSQLDRLDCSVDRFLIFTREHLSNEDLSSAVIPVLKKAFPGTAVGTGTNANFAELNRNRPDPHLPDFLTYSMHPQAHASDPLSMVENLTGQRDTVLTARSFAAGKPICISPVTLKPRFNVVATSDTTNDRAGDALPDNVDQRQPSLFCAGWTVGSFKNLAEAGAGSITFYQTAGRGGIIHGDHHPLSPHYFMADKGDIYPVYFLFRELLKYREYQVRKIGSSHPLRFSAAWLEGPTEQQLILANHSASIQQIRLPEGHQCSHAWVLDEHTISDLRAGSSVRQGLQDPSQIFLNPFAIAFLKIMTVKS